METEDCLSHAGRMGKNIRLLIPSLEFTNHNPSITWLHSSTVIGPHLSSCAASVKLLLISYKQSTKTWTNTRSRSSEVASIIYLLLHFS